MDKMIELENLTKRFGEVLAVDSISLSVRRGEVLGFLGPNGAGKSTTMKMITGFMTPTSGTARVCGFDIGESPIEVKKRVGYLPEGAPLYPDMTAGGFLDFIAGVRGLSGGERKRRIDWAIDATQLDEVVNFPVDTLSKGFKRRVGLAQALLHDPDVLILDEPTDGLDPNQKFEVRKLILRMAKEKAIVISTHILEEVDAVCTRAVIIARGRLVADGTPERLEAHSPYHNSITIQLENRQTAAIRRALLQLEGVDQVLDGGSSGGRARVTVLPAKGRNIVDTVRAAATAGEWPVAEIVVNRGRLDDVFREITNVRG